MLVFTKATDIHFCFKKKKFFNHMFFYEANQLCEKKKELSFMLNVLANCTI